MRLADKVIIVTGSTTGIGEAIARRCGREGAAGVVVHGLEREFGEKVVSEVNADAGRDIAALIVADLSDPIAAGQLVDFAIERFGRLDAVVNNAADIARTDVHTTTPQVFDRVMAVNARAPLMMIQAALPHLERSHGCVLNIGSINGYCGEPNLLAYSMSKGALMTMTRNLGDALHLNHGVRVNQITVNWVLTENEDRVQQQQGNPPDWHAKVPKVFAPAGRLMHPEEIAEAAVYFLSDAAGPISGNVVDVGQFPVIGRNPPKIID